MDTLTKDDVKITAKILIATNQSTTSLDIKLYLRTQGFWATQAIVSQFMQDLCNEGEFNYSYNGGYRTYTIDAQSNIPVVADYLHYTRKGIAITAFESRIPNTKCFKVFSTANANVLYVPAKFTRDQARCAFSKITNSDYINTRVKSLK